MTVDGKEPPPYLIPGTPKHIHIRTHHHHHHRHHNHHYHNRLCLPFCLFSSSFPVEQGAGVKVYHVHTPFTPPEQEASAAQASQGKSTLPGNKKKLLAIACSNALYDCVIKLRY